MFLGEIIVMIIALFKLTEFLIISTRKNYLLFGWVLVHENCIEKSQI